MKCYKCRFILASVAYLILHFAAPGATNELTEEQKQMLKNLHDNCVAETGTAESLIEEAGKGKFADDNKLKMDDDGTMDFEAYLDILPDHLKEWGEKTMNKCKHIKPDGDACDAAFKMNACFYEADPGNYKLF